MHTKSLSFISTCEKCGHKHEQCVNILVQSMLDRRETLAGKLMQLVHVTVRPACDRTLMQHWGSLRKPKNTNDFFSPKRRKE